jgi:ABC-type uncharacterized transport system substrate-binding protein
LRHRCFGTIFSGARLDRRRFIAGTAAWAALAALRTARGQNPAPRLGILCYGSQANLRSRADALRKGLAELGYAEGGNLRCEWRFANGQMDLVDAYARELASRGPQLLYSGSYLVTPRLAAAAPATPIVAASEEAFGIPPDKARVAPNVVGVFTAPLDQVPKALGLLGASLPRISNLAVLVDPSHPPHSIYRARVESLGQAMRFRPAFFDADEGHPLERAFAAMQRAKPDALLVMTSAFLYNQRRTIADLASGIQVPAMYPQRGHVEAGGLMSYGEDHDRNFQRSAVLVDRVLKGASPADIPMEPSPRIEFVVNRAAAESLGVTLPPELSRRVDRFVG